MIDYADSPAPRSAGPVAATREKADLSVAGRRGRVQGDKNVTSAHEMRRCFDRILNDLFSPIRKGIGPAGERAG